jgi:hypothetical protein
MKKLLVLFSFLALQACGPEENTVEMTAYTPILMKRADLAQSIKVLPAREIKEAGKIYIYQNLLYINDKFRGIHVFDNSDPTNPTAIGFISIPGNLDVAIKNGMMYADNSVDLVAFTYDGQNVVLADRKQNVFPEIVPPDFGAIPSEYLPENRPENTVIIRWEEKK